MTRFRCFPGSFEYVAMNKNLTSCVQIRELFVPLPEMVEERIRASAAARNELSTRLGGADARCGDRSAGTESCHPIVWSALGADTI